MISSAKKYEKLKDLQKSLRLSQEDLYSAIESSFLKTAIQLPLCHVELCVLKDRRFTYKDHGPVEGFVGIRSEDALTIFSHGCAQLRKFISIEQGGPILRLAKPSQQSISVRIEDLLVLKEHAEEFKRVYKINSMSIDDFKASDDYRHVIFKGMEFHLGDVQRKIIKKLHKAALTRDPWVSGRTLIHEAGLWAGKLRTVFNKEPARKAMIVSDKHGYYRLDLPLNDHAKL